MSWLNIFRRRSRPAATAEPPSPTTRSAGRAAQAPDAVGTALDALLNAPDWAETRAVLEREKKALLGDAALARLQALLGDVRRDVDVQREALLGLYLGLLQGARQDGVPAAWDEFQTKVKEREAAANALGPTLLGWLNAGSAREGRRYLEAHPELLHPEADLLFDALTKQYAGNGDALGSLAIHRALLHGARTRGGTGQAIRDACVDAQGGLALDAPAWVEEAEGRAAALEGQPAQQAQVWRDALARAGQEPGLAPEIAAAIRQNLWEALYYAGEDQEAGIATLEAALPIYTRERYPVQWAMVQSNLGNVYADRAAGDHADNIERAIQCLEGALSVYTAERYPAQWAIAQGNLGAAYRARPAGDRADNQERALACFDAALAIYTREAYPAQWANAQNNVALAYADRIRGDRADNLEQAIVHYAAALEVYTKETYPPQWAMVQNNLGIAHRNRLLGDAAENQERALACYTAALEVRTREAMPGDWAATENNLGRLYVDRIRGERADNVERAIACFQAAQTVRTREAAPYQWAMTQNNLGDAYLERVQGGRAENVERALACYASTLEIYTREAYPDDWANTQRNCGNALLELTDEDWVGNIERAIVAYMQALTVYTREANPREWAATQGYLATAYKNRIRGDRAENYEQALALYGEIAEVFTREAAPSDWAATQINLGNAYLERVAGDHADNVERAIGCYEAALAVNTREANPAEWAKTQGNLAAALSLRIRGDRAENVERALGCVQASLEVYTREASPADWAAAKHNLGKIYVDRIRGERADNVERAIACHGDALGVFTRAAYPVEWARSQVGLGNAYKARIRGERADNVERALECAAAALAVYTRDAFPVDWALAQNNLGNAYADRIRGERADNLERAILCYQAALEIRTREALPVDWAATQTNLGGAYADRIRESRAENLERAIGCYEAALAVYTRDAEPLLWAATENNLGSAYRQRQMGERGDNLERALLCYQATLEVYTRDSAPADWARMQNNLGDAFYDRIQGDHADNVERAIAYMAAAQEVYTRGAYPESWALARKNQGRMYKQRVQGDRRANFDQAAACYQDALGVYTREGYPREWGALQSDLGNLYHDQARAGLADDAAADERAVGYYTAALAVYPREGSPVEHRRVMIQLAEAEAQRGDWAAAHAAYDAARQTEEMLLALGSGARGRDLVLQLTEGRESGTRDAYALARLGRLEDALLAAERGRARGLAEMRALQSADPARITHAGRRTLFLAARDRLLEAQAAANRPWPAGTPEEERRDGDLARAAALREAQAQFDAVVAEVRAAGDPADFLRDELDMGALWRAAARGPAGHGLVYLLATPWGGAALSALSGDPARGTANRAALLDLPALSSDLVSDLIQAELSELSGKVIGGFGHAQEGRGFSFIAHGYPGATFAEKAASLHAECASAGLASALDDAAREILAYPAIAAIAARPLTETEYAQLDPTLEFAYLQHELRRCLPRLADVALRPVVAWLREGGAASATFIPTGALAAFPLLAAPVGAAGEWETVGDALAATVAPSARALLAAGPSATRRAGVTTLGDPRPTHQALQWGEAEAQTLARLGGDAERVKIHEQATRAWLLEALGAAEVVDACCHGEFDPLDFLASRLLLANGERLTLGEMLGGTTGMDGLRLLILSACQTAILDLRGARDEVRSLAAGMLQAGARAVLGAQWSVDDKATYLLMARFAQEWFPVREREAPAAALARAKRWLRTVTNRELRAWESAVGVPGGVGASGGRPQGELLAVRGGGMRYGAAEAAERVAASAGVQADDARPFADPIYWSAFQITGW